MHDQILVAVVADAPVESPFQHCEGLIDRQRLERQRSVEPEQNLRLHPTSEAARWSDAHVKIGEALPILDRVIRVMPYDALRDLAQAGLDPVHYRSRAQPQAGAGQAMRQLVVCQVADDHRRSGSDKPSRLNSARTTSTTECQSESIVAAGSSLSSTAMSAALRPPLARSG